MWYLWRTVLSMIRMYCHHTYVYRTLATAQLNIWYQNKTLLKVCHSLQSWTNSLRVPDMLTPVLPLDHFYFLHCRSGLCHVYYTIWCPWQLALVKPTEACLPCHYWPLCVSQHSLNILTTDDRPCLGCLAWTTPQASGVMGKRFSNRTPAHCIHNYYFAMPLELTSNLRKALYSWKVK